MAWWQWVVDAAGVLLLLVLLYGLYLVVRRRILGRHGGTFELSATPANGWSGSASSRSRPAPSGSGLVTG
jgi:hypothetical protein